ncbi:MAG: ABC transporter substrate-binding protein [Oxalobacteraceae bacterium]|jgi:branched-chain amino acid transport system substrate-binding protein|nr:ABC transporter substrate-binding protein [Oxalobacteraceae bacterium]
MKKSRLWSVMLAMLLAPPAWAEMQGVNSNEILIGSVQDLSGPIAALGKWVRNGMQMRVDEINAQGGIHGRKIKLLMEDSAYDPKKAVLAVQKLVNQDKVFMVVGHMGTAHNNAAMPIQFEKNIANFLPTTGARDMFEPLHPLKFALLPPYFSTMQVQTPELYKAKKATKPCIIYQDDDYGLEVLGGAEAGLKSIGVELMEKTTYKRGATDFSSQVAKLKSAGCDFVVMGTLVRDTVTILGEARKVGMTATMMGSYVTFTELIPKLGGKVAEGFYAVSLLQTPYDDAASPALREWVAKYKAKFDGGEPTIQSEIGYMMIDIFARASQKAGPALDTKSFVSSMESLGKVEYPMFESPVYSWTATRRLGSAQSRMSIVENGRWKELGNYK